jgi:hypothetical protein
MNKITGSIVERGIAVRTPSYRTAVSVRVFYLKINGLDKTLEIYRMKNNYQGLLNELSTGIEVTAYYEDTQLVQLEKNGNVIIDSSEYKKKESALIYIGLVTGIGSVLASVWYFKKHVVTKR